MVIFLAMVGALWGIGAAMKTPRSLRFIVIGLLYFAVLMAVGVLPEENGIRQAFGASFAEWATLGLFAGAFVGYRRVLRAVRARALSRADQVDNAAQSGPFKAAELERYARHIILREIGGVGQRKLKDAKVLVIGAGGLGAPVLQYLAASGVGTIGVIDDDVVDASNLQRQVIHTDARQDMPKVFSAQIAMEAQNPFITVKPYNRRFDASCAALVAEYDLVIDGSDNFDTRYLVNALCVAAGKPLLAAAIAQWEGQISLYHPANGGPCYQCVFPQRPADGMTATCAEAGVCAPLPGILGTLLAMEAIKEISGAGQGLSGRIMMYDALYAETRVITAQKRVDCPTCGGAGAGDDAGLASTH